MLTEKEEIIEEKTLIHESLLALKDCKRVVELKFQNCLSERSRLDSRVECMGREADLLAARNCSLEEERDTFLWRIDTKVSLA